MSATPKVLIIGDSISMGYTPCASKLLAGRCEVARNEGNAGDSRNVVSKLDEWLAACADAELVHFNCGLHDLKTERDSDLHQVPLSQYKQNLAEIADRLGGVGKTIVWATSTPVIYERHLSKGFDRRQEDVDAYNTAALEIVNSAGFAVNDLHAAILQAGSEKCLSSDGVHMTDQGYEILGQAVASEISRHLGLVL